MKLVRRKSVQKNRENKSLRTLYLYTVFVIGIICVSLFLKLMFVIQQSKFDGQHHFTLAVTKDQRVKEIIAFSPQVPALAVLQIKDETITYPTLGRSYGIAADAQLEVGNVMPIGGDVTATMWDATTHYTSVKTNATIIDYIRLTILSRDIVTNNKVIRSISLTEKRPENNTIIARALNDPTLSSENVSIQIINASNISGIGQRLSRILTNMGANVVEVSTSHQSQPKSKIQYFGEKTYTLDQLQSYLAYPVSELQRQPIANIVIILGEDSRGTTEF